MPQASAYAPIKQALVTRLSARPALAGVSVLGHVPVNTDEIRGPGGAPETVYVAGAEGVSEDIVFCAGGLRFDETFTLDVVCEVHGTDSSATQEQVDGRCNELLYELLADIAGQKDWDLPDLGLDVFDYLYFTPSTYLWGAARLQQTGVFAANVTQGLQVKARRSFT